MMTKCWNCGKLQFVCNSKHFFGPVLTGLAFGVILAVPIGFLLLMIDHIFNFRGQ
jgi:hypothetical protein